MTTNGTPGNGATTTQNPAEAWANLTNASRLMTDTFVRASQAAAEAQTAYLESLLGGIQSNASKPATSQYAKAFQVWSDAMMEANRLSVEAIRKGEAPPTEEIFDLWTNAQADMLRNVIWSPAFAAAQGQAVESALDARRRGGEQAEAQVRAMGIPTRSDLVEVGRRLVELERRQHELTRLLQALVEAQESVAMVPGGQGEDATEGGAARGSRRPKRQTGGA